MGDEDDVADIIAQVVLEPGDALGVEMVGRLVEQQDVGLFEQQLAQGDSTLLTARQVRDRTVARWATQCLHRDLELVVEAPAVDRVDLLLQVAHFGEQCVEITILGRIAHDRDDLVIAIDHPADRARARAHVADHVLGLVELGLLRQIADLDALGGPRLAGEFGVDPAHDLHERRLARAVRPDDRDLGVGEELERDVVEHRLGGAGEGLGQALHHIAVLHGHRLRTPGVKMVDCWHGR